MKKLLSLFILLVSMLMTVAACSQPAADINSTSDTASARKEETQEIEVKKTEYGTEEVVLEGKKLEQLTVTGTDNPYYCNLEENLKIKYNMEIEPVLVCKDPVYDITYYANYGRDNYIYAYRNGKSELAVEIPAKDLFCKEGELYFIAATDGRHQFSSFAEGNILKYNPKDGTVTVVLDCSADKMIVYPDGICYKQIGEAGQTSTGYSRKEEEFFFSFATGESSLFPKITDELRRWKGNLLEIEQEFQYVEISETETDPYLRELYALGYTSVGEETGRLESINLVDMQGNVKETWPNVNGSSKYFWMSGDSIYYVERREEESGKHRYLKMYNKQTDTHEDIVKLAYGVSLAIEDMIFHDGVVYFSNGLRVELDSGAQCLMQQADGTSTRLEYFYTDGQNLFCVSSGKIWIMKERPGVPISAREFIAGMPLEIGTYVYQLCEP